MSGLILVREPFRAGATFSLRNRRKNNRESERKAWLGRCFGTLAPRDEPRPSVCTGWAGNKFLERDGVARAGRRFEDGSIASSEGDNGD